MAAQNGNDFLLKMDIASTMTTIAGCQSTTFSLAGEVIDVTTKDSSHWRELLAGGKRTLDVSFNGVYADDATFNAVQVAVLANSLESFEVVLPGTIGGAAGTFAFSGILDTLENTGDNDAGVTFSATIKSTGIPVFTDLV